MMPFRSLSCWTHELYHIVVIVHLHSIHSYCWKKLIFLFKFNHIPACYPSENICREYLYVQCSMYYVLLNNAGPHGQQVKARTLLSIWVLSCMDKINFRKQGKRIIMQLCAIVLVLSGERAQCMISMFNEWLGQWAHGFPSTCCSRLWKWKFHQKNRQLCLF